jgi:cyclopropane-fatty-acyl-phospholipid synthase
VWRLVRPGGLFCNHGIVTGQAERVAELRGRTFAGRYVFPDGGLVPVWRALQAFQRPGFHALDVEQLRPHYALTLRAWLANLEQRHAEAVAATSEADYRIWRAYMAASTVGFESGDMGVVQILGSRRTDARADPPLGRAWMLSAD